MRTSLASVATLVAQCAAQPHAWCQGDDNKGNDFLLAFLPNDIDLAAGRVELHLTSDIAADVTVQYPAYSPALTSTVSLTPGNISVVDLPIKAANGWAADQVNNNTVRAFSSATGGGGVK